MKKTRKVEKPITPQNSNTVLSVSHLRDTEQAILNYMIFSKDNFLTIKNRLTKDDFTFNTHKIIFHALCFLEDFEKFPISIGLLVKIAAMKLAEEKIIEESATLDILSQSPSMHIDKDLEVINAYSMEKEIATHNEKIVQYGTIETKYSLTEFHFINNRLISVTSTDIAHLPTELHDNFSDTFSSICSLNLDDKDIELTVTFYKIAENKNEIESLNLTKDISAGKWFNNICKWADKYELDEKTFPRDRFKLQNLQSLKLPDKNIDELPKEIGKLTSLRVLDISNNSIKELPDEIYQLKNLTLLIFINNHIKNISNEIINLKKLSHIFACNNDLYLLPKSFFKLKNLLTLCIHGNRFTSLPDDIGNFTELTDLSISNNDITTLPPTIVNLKNLTSLDIENTQIKNIPIELLKNTKLKKLSINDDLFPFIAKNIQYLDVDTINLTASDIKNSSKIVKKLNLKIDTENWVEEKDKKENGCVQLSKYIEETEDE